MDVYKALKQLGACEEEAQKFKGLSVRKAWKVASFGNILWILSFLSVPELLDYVWENKLNDHTTADDLREMLPVPTEADLKAAVRIHNRVEKAFEDGCRGSDYGTYHSIRDRVVKSRPWVLNPKAVAA